MFCVCGASIAVEMGVVGGVVSSGTLNFGSYRTKTRTFTRHLKLLSNAQTFPSDSLQIIISIMSELIRNTKTWSAIPSGLEGFPWRPEPG